ncbi:MAG: hypothetical protein RJA44_152 [Pseudomonadota bacterium]
MTIETLIQEILRAPAVDVGSASMRQNRSLLWLAAPAGDNEAGWEWYDSSYDLQAGLDVTEHQIPVELCAAVFQNTQRHFRHQSRQPAF